ncbi:hypothetical protein [Geomesophilobacter sediminis]|uniref:Uncharacterized protein n=1 Tax=Geomesophilobacter sediminis TaxID=2798584 RepID=A0A8J7J6G8_9BACT|nr:hypothetical protein [Geomesophilobacter sediminis]MBJ6724391.1 hypothetical protein [Geomesophilobacter sediminis]
MQFRLSVWKPAELFRAVDYAPDEATPHTVKFNPCYLQEQIYQWDPGSVDVWMCVEGSENAELVRDMLRLFSADLHPSKRDMKAFAAFVQQLVRMAEDPEASSWSDTTETIEIQSDETNLRCNSFVALVNHLQWVLHVFEGIPNSSVVIR